MSVEAKTSLSWASVAAHLRSIGIVVPDGQPAEQEPAQRQSAPPPAESTEENQGTSRPADQDRKDWSAVLRSAKSAGVLFFERLSDGELIAENLHHLTVDPTQDLQACWADTPANSWLILWSTSFM